MKKRFSANSLLALLLWTALTPGAGGAERTLQTEANVMVELTFTAASAWADPFNEVTLDAIFIDSKGRELRVPAFWAGGKVWKARYASPVPGLHRFRTECSDARDQGLHGITGKVEVKPYRGQNLLYMHGPIQTSANHRFLPVDVSNASKWKVLGEVMWWVSHDKVPAPRENAKNP